MTFRLLLHRSVFYITHVFLVIVSFLIAASAAYGIGIFFVGAEIQSIIGNPPDRSHPIFWTMLIITLVFFPVTYIGILHAVIVPIQIWLLPGFPLLLSPGVTKADQRNGLVLGLKKYSLALSKFEERYRLEHIEKPGFPSEKK